MYNDTIKVANKIISDNDLIDIFNKMDEDIRKYEAVCKKEEQENIMYEREYQSWTAKNFDGKFKVTVNFYDDTTITFDNYNSFIGVFNTRIAEIKSLWLRYSYFYYVKYKGQYEKNFNQSIEMSIYDNKMDITVRLSSEDKKMDEVYNFIKSKILNAPEKYDRIIQKKSSIISKIGFSLGIIPSTIICTALLFVPTIREIYSISYVGFPIAAIVFGFLIGSMFFTGGVNSLYDSIMPEKKYSHYDVEKGRSVYVDDLDKFKSTSDILIGHKIDILKNRNEIKEMEEKYSKLIPYELIIVAVLSLLAVVVGKFI